MHELIKVFVQKACVVRRSTRADDDGVVGATAVLARANRTSRARQHARMMPAR